MLSSLRLTCSNRPKQSQLTFLVTMQIDIYTERLFHQIYGFYVSVHQPLEEEIKTAFVQINDLSPCSWYITEAQYDVKILHRCGTSSSISICKGWIYSTLSWGLERLESFDLFMPCIRKTNAAANENVNSLIFIWYGFQT